jgi:hypothetical protein
MKAIKDSWDAPTFKLPSKYKNAQYSSKRAATDGDWKTYSKNL